jgi:hypothetical protein
MRMFGFNCVKSRKRLLRRRRSQRQPRNQRRRPGRQQPGHRRHLPHQLQRAYQRWSQQEQRQQQ